VGGTSEAEYWVGSGTHLLSALDPTLVTSHSVTLAGLVKATIYSYIVHSQDAAGVDHVSSTSTFKTAAH
jgi:ABC-type sulfate transport system permease component